MDVAVRVMYIAAAYLAPSVCLVCKCKNYSADRVSRLTGYETSVRVLVLIIFSRNILAPTASTCTLIKCL